MFSKRITSLAIAAATIGMALLGGSNRAEGALRLTVNSGASSAQVFTSSTNDLSTAVIIDGYSVVLETVLTNLLPNGGSVSGGTLSTTSNITTGPGPLSDLVILAEVIADTAPLETAPLAHFTVPSGVNGLVLTGQAGGTPGNATAGFVDFTASSNGVNATVTGINIPNSEEANVGPAQLAPTTTGYTMSQLITIRGLSTGSDSITVNASQRVSAVPEPGTMAMACAGLGSLGFGRWIRRRRVQA